MVYNFSKFLSFKINFTKQFFSFHFMKWSELWKTTTNFALGGIWTHDLLHYCNKRLSIIVIVIVIVINTRTQFLPAFKHADQRDERKDSDSKNLQNDCNVERETGSTSLFHEHEARLTKYLREALLRILESKSRWGTYELKRKLIEGTEIIPLINLYSVMRSERTNRVLCVRPWGPHGREQTTPRLILKHLVSISPQGGQILIFSNWGQNLLHN